jgi:hypothetical protein
MNKLMTSVLNLPGVIVEDYKQTGETLIGSIPILQVCKSMIKSIPLWENLHLASQKNLF